MRIGILVNSIATESSIYTTTVIARTAVQRGHSVTYIDIADLAVQPDGTLTALGRRTCDPGAERGEFLTRLQTCRPVPVRFDDIDLLWNRHAATFDLEERPWAHPLGWHFGWLARQAGVLVLSDPDGLAMAGPEKLYTLRFPARHRPPTLVTRDLEAVRSFVAEQPDGTVLKPLDGGAGESVFLVGPDDPNLAQIFTAVARRGYVVAQPYLPEAKAGVIRIFLLDGEVLTVDGRIAAHRHLPAGSDIRTNFAIAGSITAATLENGGLDQRHLAAAAAAGPELAADGMFLVGLDIVGDQILEANLHSPGGLRGAQRLAGADFCSAVVAAMETQWASPRARG